MKYIRYSSSTYRFEDLKLTENYLHTPAATEHMHPIEIAVLAFIPCYQGEAVLKLKYCCAIDNILWQLVVHVYHAEYRARVQVPLENNFPHVTV